MFGEEIRKVTFAELDKALEEYKTKFSEILEKSKLLYSERKYAVDLLIQVDEYIHSLSNKPKELEKEMEVVELKRQDFENEIEKLKKDWKKDWKKEEDALKTETRIAIATAFGTAAAGTSISVLSGAAATNVALAYFGTGALALGGAGMATSEAVLAALGPIGWAIAGVILFGSGIMLDNKKKKEIEKQQKQVEQKIMTIKEGINELKKKEKRIIEETKSTSSLNLGIGKVLADLKRNRKRNYRWFSKTEKEQLMQLMNASNALSKRIGEKIS